MKSLEIVKSKIDFFGKCELNKREVGLVIRDLTGLELLKNKFDIEPKSDEEISEDEMELIERVWRE
mgnify:CR=1 FL=1